MEQLVRDIRVVLWEGGSLWAIDVLETANRERAEAHAHHAYQVTLRASGSVGILEKDQLHTADCIIVAPDQPHAIRPSGRIVLLFVDPESGYGRALRRRMDGQSVVTQSVAEHVRGRLEHLWDRPKIADSAVIDLGIATLAALLGNLPAGPSVDPRISKVLAWVERSIEQPCPADAAADIACLSESRFSHLFVEQVGLPFRTYVLWKKLTRAVESIAQGASLTESAHTAGFSDSAHFSRTFRRMFGLPADALKFNKEATA
jgi:AraC-like DNA-binding protein